MAHACERSPQKLNPQGQNPTGQRWWSPNGPWVLFDHWRSHQPEEIEYDTQKDVVTVGVGFDWDEVYAALGPLRVGVIGGRVTGVRNHLITFDIPERD